MKNKEVINILEQAESFAKEKHKGQFRLFSKEPYFYHLKNVLDNVDKCKQSHKKEELLSAALLHDVLEKTDTSFEELNTIFGETISLIVRQLTITKEDLENSSKKFYLAKKMSDSREMTSWALVIKLADRLDNVSDLDIASLDFRKNYVEETDFIINFLEKNRALSRTQKILVKKIKDKISIYLNE